MPFGPHAGNPAWRLSDAERERAVADLKHHYVEGRLGTEELEARIDAIFRTHTRRRVAAHLRDLPMRGARAVVGRRIRSIQRAVLRMHVLTFLTINGSLVAIWALTGEGSFWPAILLVPSLAVLGWHMAASRALTRVMARHHW